MNLDNNKSAKEYISEAYMQELTAIQDKAKLMETPTSIIEKEKIENTIKLAEEVLSMNILNDETTSEYNDLNALIKAKKDEITKLYGIEVSQDGLQAIKNAYLVVSNSFAEYLKTNDDEFNLAQQVEYDEVNAKIDADTLANDEKVNAIYDEISIKKDANKQETQREQAEYDYNLKRTRKQNLEIRNKAIADREKTMQLKEQEVNERHQSCLDELQKIAELQAKVDDIPNLIMNAKLEGASEKEKELGKDYGYKSAISKKDSELQISDLQNEYNRLENKYNILCKEKNSLSEKLDKCYAESRQLATDTVKSTGGINILNSDNHQYGQNNKK